MIDVLSNLYSSRLSDKSHEYKFCSIESGDNW